MSVTMGSIMHQTLAVLAIAMLATATTTDAFARSNEPKPRMLLNSDIQRKPHSPASGDASAQAGKICRCGTWSNRKDSGCCHSRAAEIEYANGAGIQDSHVRQHYASPGAIAHSIHAKPD